MRVFTIFLFSISRRIHACIVVSYQNECFVKMRASLSCLHPPWSYEVRKAALILMKHSQIDWTIRHPFMRGLRTSKNYLCTLSLFANPVLLQYNYNTRLMTQKRCHLASSQERQLVEQRDRRHIKQGWILVHWKMERYT